MKPLSDPNQEAQIQAWLEAGILVDRIPIETPEQLKHEIEKRIYLVRREEDAIVGDDKKSYHRRQLKRAEIVGLSMAKRLVVDHIEALNKKARLEQLRMMEQAGEV